MLREGLHCFQRGSQQFQNSVIEVPRDMTMGGATPQATLHLEGSCPLSTSQGCDQGAGESKPRSPAPLPPSGLPPKQCHHLGDLGDLVALLLGQDKVTSKTCIFSPG